MIKFIYIRVWFFNVMIFVCLLGCCEKTQVEDKDGSDLENVHQSYGVMFFRFPQEDEQWSELQHSIHSHFNLLASRRKKYSDAGEVLYTLSELFRETLEYHGFDIGEKGEVKFLQAAGLIYVKAPSSVLENIKGVLVEVEGLEVSEFGF